MKLDSNNIIFSQIDYLNKWLDSTIIKYREDSMNYVNNIDINFDDEFYNIMINIIYSYLYFPFNGNLYDARLNAARATSSGTELISKIIVPGFTTATQ